MSKVLHIKSPVWREGLEEFHEKKSLDFTPRAMGSHGRIVSKRVMF